MILLYLCRAVDAGTRVQPRSRLTRTLLVTENLTVTERAALRIDGMCALVRRRDKLSFRNLARRRRRTPARPRRSPIGMWPGWPPTRSPIPG